MADKPRTFQDAAKASEDLDLPKRMQVSDHWQRTTGPEGEPTYTVKFSDVKADWSRKDSSYISSRPVIEEPTPPHDQIPSEKEIAKRTELVLQRVESHKDNKFFEDVKDLQRKIKEWSGDISGLAILVELLENKVDEFAERKNVSKPKAPNL